MFAQIVHLVGAVWKTVHMRNVVNSHRNNFASMPEPKDTTTELHVLDNHLDVVFLGLQSCILMFLQYFWVERSQEQEDDNSSGIGRNVNHYFGVLQLMFALLKSFNFFTVLKSEIGKLFRSVRHSNDHNQINLIIVWFITIITRATTRIRSTRIRRERGRKNADA